MAALFEFISARIWASICDVMALRPEFDPFFQHLKFDNVQRANSQMLPKTKKKEKKKKKRMKADAVKGNVHHQQNVNTTTNNVNKYLYIWHPQFFSEQQQLQPLYPPPFSSSSLLTISRNKIASFSLPHLFSFTFSLPWSVSLSVSSRFQLR